MGPRQDGFVSNLFLFPKKGSGQIPVINLKLLNQFVKYEHFEMENIHMLRDLLKKTTIWSKIDLKGAYFTVGKSPEISEVSLEGDSLRVCLPSIRTCFSPRVFTKIMKPVVGLLHQLGYAL